MLITHGRALQGKQRSRPQIGHQIEAGVATGGLGRKAELGQRDTLPLTVEAGQLKLAEIPLERRLAQGQRLEGGGGGEDGLQISRPGVMDLFAHQQGRHRPLRQEAGGAADTILRPDQQQAALTLVGDSGRDQVVGLDRVAQGIGARSLIAPRSAGGAQA